MFLVYNSPTTHPRISFSEKQYIEKSIGHTEEKATLSYLVFLSIKDEISSLLVCYHSEYSFSFQPPTPWKDIFTSVPFWAILVAHTCNNWGFYTLLTTMPTYMKKVLRFNIANVSII